MKLAVRSSLLGGYRHPVTRPWLQLTAAARATNHTLEPSAVLGKDRKTDCYTVLLHTVYSLSFTPPLGARLYERASLSTAGHSKVHAVTSTGHAFLAVRLQAARVHITVLELTAPFNEKGKVTHTLKLQRNSNLAAPAVRLKEKRREKKRKHPWRFKGKTSTRAFLTQLTQLTHKTLKRRLRRNHVRTKQAALSVAASSKALQPPFAGPRDQGLGPTAGARSLARFASRLSSSWRKRNFAHLFAP